MSTKKAAKPVNHKKLFVRGCVTNSLGGAILYGVAKGLGIPSYVNLAAGIQLAVFLFHGLPQRSEKFYDLSGSVTHFSLVAASVCGMGGAGMGGVMARSPRQLMVALCSVVWMTRLGTFLFLRISRDGKDERFDAIKPNFLIFLGAWNLQAAWVTLTQLPVILLNATPDTTALGLMDGVALALWAIGFGFEFVADLEKFTFRGKAENRHKYITTGLWALCKHPNYFGELAMWSAMALAASHAALVAGAPSLLHWAWLSPAFAAILLIKGSGAPLVDKAGAKKWGSDPRYQAYVSGTSFLVPWFPATLPPE